MSLRQIMGSAYNENLTLQEIEAFFEGNSKIVNLSIGGYVSKEKFDDVNQKYQALQNETKDFEDIKSKYETLVAKQEKDGQIALINKYVKPEFAEYVLYQMKQGNLTGDKLEDNVKAYIKQNTQYGVEKTSPQNKVINTYSNTDLGTGKQPATNPNQSINDAIRSSLGRPIANE